MYLALSCLVMDFENQIILKGQRSDDAWVTIKLK